jgi:hypothetical protein
MTTPGGVELNQNLWIDSNGLIEVRVIQHQYILFHAYFGLSEGSESKSNK